MFQSDTAMPNPERDVLRTLLLGLLVLLPAALVPVVGLLALPVSGLLLVALLLVRGTPVRHGLWSSLAAIAALLGGLIGVYSAGFALTELGRVPPYDTRAAFGWAALVLATVATAGGLMVRSRPVAGSALMALSGALGAVAISLFYINTLYWAALPLWLLAAVFGLAGARGSR